jgi:hypothetical protein
MTWTRTGVFTAGTAPRYVQPLFSAWRPFLQRSFRCKAPSSVKLTQLTPAVAKCAAAAWSCSAVLFPAPMRSSATAARYPTMNRHCLLCCRKEEGQLVSSTPRLLSLDVSGRTSKHRPRCPLSVRLTESQALTKAASMAPKRSRILRNECKSATASLRL